jgi:hypothetical protein
MRASGAHFQRRWAQIERGFVWMMVNGLNDGDACFDGLSTNGEEAAGTGDHGDLAF